MANTHRVNRAGGWPIERPDYGQQQIRYDLGVEFDALAKDEKSELLFPKETIAEGVQSRHLVVIASEKGSIKEEVSPSLPTAADPAEPSTKK